MYPNSGHPNPKWRVKYTHSGISDLFFQILDWWENTFHVHLEVQGWETPETLGCGETWQKPTLTEPETLPLGGHKSRFLRDIRQSENGEKNKGSSSRQTSQTNRKKWFNTPYLISFTHTHAHPFEVRKLAGCRSNFRPREDCSGNCHGAIWVAPKRRWRKGNRDKDHRFWQSWADLLQFPLPGLREPESRASFQPRPFS